jgi:fructose 5-dehydrogenase cytochrome subunit
VGDSHVQAQLADSGTTNGATLYADACASCHQLEAKGTKDDFYPSLAHSTATGAVNPSNLIMTILNGVSREGADGRSFMPSFASQLSNDQIAAVANHVLTRFGRPETQVTTAMVADARTGGQKPLLLKLIPWLFAGAGLVAAWIAFLFLRRRTSVGA